MVQLTDMESIISSPTEMLELGQSLGRSLSGGEVIVLTGDVGAGKTVLTKGIAIGMGVQDDIQSPTFTISRVYQTPKGLRLNHYDFYRLDDPGIMAAELEEAVYDSEGVTVIEWADIVESVIPKNAIRIEIIPRTVDTRRVISNGWTPKGVSKP